MRIFTTIMFFIASKIIWFLISPLSFIVLLLCIGGCLRLFKKGKVVGRFLITASFILLIICSLVPIGYNAFVFLERQTSQINAKDLNVSDIGGIIVLGGCMDAGLTDLYGTPQFNGSCERLVEGIRLHNAFPDVPFIYTGGSGAVTNQAYKGADAAKDLLVALGEDTHSIMFERESRNTYENMLYSRKMLEISPVKPWLLVTSSYHMPRAMNVFCHGKWPVIPYPTDFKTNKEYGFRFLHPLSNINSLADAMKEVVGIMAYGRTGKLSLNACDTLLD